MPKGYTDFSTFDIHLRAVVARHGTTTFVLRQYRRIIETLIIGVDCSVKVVPWCTDCSYCEL